MENDLFKSSYLFEILWLLVTSLIELVLICRTNDDVKKKMPIGLKN